MYTFSAHPLPIQPTIAIQITMDSGLHIMYYILYIIHFIIILYLTYVRVHFVHRRFCFRYNSRPYTYIIIKTSGQTYLHCPRPSESTNLIQL